MLFTLCFVAVLSMMCVVHAAPLASTASVHVKDNSAGTGADITECSQGVTLWVFWTQSPSGTVVEIQVYAPDGTLIHDISNLHQSDSGTSLLKFTTTQSGIYYIVVLGAYNRILRTDSIAVQTVLVLPESPLGALTATSAAFAAFGTFGLIKVKRKKR